MVRKSLYLMALLALLLGPAALLRAQVPTGTISGNVTDPSGAAVPDAKIHVVSANTVFKRTLSSGGSGDFSVSALTAGHYTIDVEAQGFKKLVQDVDVTAGAIAKADLQLQLGSSTESVTVQASAAQLDYESHSVEGTITREQIQALPLNGRHFLQLAGLQPGVGVSPESSSVYNNQFSVSVMGGDPSQTRITIDGVANQDQVQGGTEQNFSQEVVQEFQISTTNFDLSTGLTASGSINIVSRTGGNDFHGGGYFFFRDHNMAAYPGLQRDPTNPDPFFVRRQLGGTLSGPIIKNKLFFFANVEHTNQTSVADIQPTSPDFAHFGVIAPNPYNGTQPSFRFDYQLNQSNTLFARYSHDGNSGFGPRGSGMPSNWVSNTNWADQSMIGWTSTPRPTLVNDLRLAYTYWSNRNLNASQKNCPNCLGLAGPQISVDGANFTIGNQPDSPQGQTSRHYIVSDNLTWQKGSHRLRAGGEIDHVAVNGFYAFDNPGQVNVYSPDEVRAYNATVSPDQQIPIPSSFNTLDDILALPLKNFEVGVGNPAQPPPFQAGNADSSTRYHLYVQDTWKITPRLTLNYGLGWNYESNLLNHDLSKPAYLAPILGANNLAAPQHYYKDFSPVIGFAYSPFKSGNTVVRGGFGIYYDSMELWKRLDERAYIGPIGNGRYPLPGSLVPNPVDGIPGVPQGTPLEFNSNPTAFTAGYLMPMLGPITDALTQELASFGSPTSLATRGINLFKTASDLYPQNYRPPQSQHFSLGAQQRLAHDWVIDGNFVWRHTIRMDMGNIDYNKWNSAAGPVIPACTSSDQLLDTTAQCSAGSIEVRTPDGRSRYAGLLVKAEKQMTKNLELMVGYTLQSQVGYNGLIDANHWFASWGPQAAHQMFTLSGIYKLPWGFEVSLINTMSSRGPVTVGISGIDITGTGLGSSILPGSTSGAFNMSMGKSDLVRLVSDFNHTYAGTTTPRDQPIPYLTLPSKYDFGQSFFDQDMRLTKTFSYRERWKLAAFVECFNCLNLANLSGYSGDLRNTASFMQPTSRIFQVFGSGGPRAIQLGTRFSF
jgi:hypothetical protein